jgi:hypothetical protein
MRLQSSATAIVAVFWCLPVLAEGQPCGGVPTLNADNAGAAPQLAVVAPRGRVHFVKGIEQDGCPSASATCAMGAFVVGGDPVVVSTTAGDYACATFTGPAPKALSTSGFLPRAQLGAPPPEKPVNASAAWAGAWRSGDEQAITIKPKPGGRIAIEGEASWGSHDPDRVKRGGVNSGDIGAEVPIVDGVAAFAIDYDGTTKPFDLKRDDNSDVCRVKLWRLGPYLVASDNLSCGGRNVTFTGVYRKAE